MTGRVRNHAIALAYSAAWQGVGRLPEALVAGAFNRVADRLVTARGPAVIQLARNLRRVLGPGATPASLHAVVTAAMRSYARYWHETFRLRTMDPADVAERALASTAGLEHLAEARRSGRGIILALPHSGNWDIAGLSMVHLLGGITTVAERLEPETVYRRFVAHREGLGFEVLPLSSDTGESARSAAVLRQRLEEGRMVCLLADRDLAGNGVPVTFFGEETTMPAGPAMLAARTGAALLPVHLSYTDSGWIQYIAPPIDLAGGRLAEQVRDGTQQLADVFAARIAMFPADWHMLQPFWSADRSTGTRAGDHASPRVSDSGQGGT